MIPDIYAEDNVHVLGKFYYLDLKARPFSVLYQQSSSKQIFAYILKELILAENAALGSVYILNAHLL